MTAFSSQHLADLFHSASTPGVFPSEFFPRNAAVSPSGDIDALLSLRSPVAGTYRPPSGLCSALESVGWPPMFPPAAQPRYSLGFHSLQGIHPHRLGTAFAVPPLPFRGPCATEIQKELWVRELSLTSIPFGAHNALLGTYPVLLRVCHPARSAGLFRELPALMGFSAAGKRTSRY